MNTIKTEPSNNINILLYHQIGDRPQANTNLDCFCNSKEFYLQMEFLDNAGYKVISLNQALNLIFDKRIIDDKYVVLTFDDGCEKFFNITYPILEKFGFPSIIYPVAGYLGKQAAWGGKKYPGLKILSKSNLYELNKLGVEIGAHTMDHVRLTQIKRNEAAKQVKDSKDTLEQLLGESITSFSYPHGDFNQGTIEIIMETGFCNAMTCISNCAQEAQSVYEIPRKYITYFDNLEGFKVKLN